MSDSIPVDAFAPELPEPPLGRPSSIPSIVSSSTSSSGGGGGRTGISNWKLPFLSLAIISPPLALLSVVHVVVDTNTDVSRDDVVLLLLLLLLLFGSATDCEPSEEKTSLDTAVEAVLLLLLIEEFETEVDVEAALGVGRRLRWP